MTQIFDSTGDMIPVTAIKFDENIVVREKTEKEDGYAACVLASVEKKAKRVPKPVAGQFPKGVTPKKYIREFRDFDAEYAVGKKMGVEVFEDVELVDVIGTTKGKGYQGVMKRHGFGGGRKTHGSKFHRTNGSTGMAATPSKVIKGTKMAGRMGSGKKTVQNLKVVRVDVGRQVLLVRGAVPGTVDSMVIVREATKSR